MMSISHRDAGDGLPLHEFGLNPRDKVTEFSHTPFANTFMKQRTMMSFNHRKKEYCVGDFIEYTSEPGKVYRIEKYEAIPRTVAEISPHAYLPREVIRCTEFCHPQQLVTEYKVRQPDLRRGEIIEIDDGNEVTLEVGGVGKKVSVSYEESDKPNELAVLDSRRRQRGDMVPAVERLWCGRVYHAEDRTMTSDAEIKRVSWLPKNFPVGEKNRICGITLSPELMC